MTIAERLERDGCIVVDAAQMPEVDRAIKNAHLATYGRRAIIRRIEAARDLAELKVVLADLVLIHIPDDED